MIDIDPTSPTATIKQAAHKMRGSITTLMAITRNIGKPIDQAELVQEAAMKKCREISELADQLDDLADALGGE